MGLGEHEEWIYEDHNNYEEIASQSNDDDDDIECDYYDSYYEDFHSDDAIGIVDHNYDNPYND